MPRTWRRTARRIRTCNPKPGWRRSERSTPRWPGCSTCWRSSIQRIAQETTETGDVDGPPYRAPSADPGRAGLRAVRLSDADLGLLAVADHPAGGGCFDCLQVGEVPVDEPGAERGPS